ncbi:MAG: hypothetical protein SWK90_00440 [Chloroflexota bacterium]|nr:hypothetical protein [Chloroflexota bacterium]
MPTGNPPGHFTPAMPTGNPPGHFTPAMPAGDHPGHFTPAMPTGNPPVHFTPAMPTGDHPGHFAPAWVNNPLFACVQMALALLIHRRLFQGRAALADAPPACVSRGCRFGVEAV